MSTGLVANAQVSQEQQDAIRKILGGTASPLCFGICRVLMAAPNGGGWQDTNLWGAITLIMDRSRNAKIIRVYDLQTYDVIFDEELYVGMQYLAARAYFHTVEVYGAILGFDFTNEQDAYNFHNRVVSMVPPAQMPAPPIIAQPAPSSSSGSFGIFDKMKVMFSKKEKEMQIGAPSNVVHRSHIGISGDKGFEVKNIPEEWKALFKASGIKPSDLKDQATASLVYNTISSHYRASVVGAPPGPAGPQQGPPGAMAPRPPPGGPGATTARPPSGPPPSVPPARMQGHGGLATPGDHVGRTRGPPPSPPGPPPGPPPSRPMIRRAPPRGPPPPPPGGPPPTRHRPQPPEPPQPPAQSYPGYSQYAGNQHYAEQHQQQQQQPDHDLADGMASLDIQQQQSYASHQEPEYDERAQQGQYAAYQYENDSPEQEAEQQYDQEYAQYDVSSPALPPPPPPPPVSAPPPPPPPTGRSALLSQIQAGAQLRRSTPAPPAAAAPPANPRNALLNQIQTGVALRRVEPRRDDEDTNDGALPDLTSMRDDDKTTMMNHIKSLLDARRDVIAADDDDDNDDWD
ncbi:CRIB domain-containing protein [Plasmodiophora brassicae]|uniref:CRIB domain-containing protein n=1 Tax=Plasmodiophora brassicae TaxID=37360 RepID=A0A0G4IXB3_PLABS|nr:hypothetical protein PBRA_007704 [Plasmodiophora brassicae]